MLNFDIGLVEKSRESTFVAMFTQNTFNQSSKILSILLFVILLVVATGNIF